MVVPQALFGRCVGSQCVGHTKEARRSFQWAVISRANAAKLRVAGGARFADVVKTTIYLQSMDDFAVVNAVYGERFVHDPPARATVEAAKLPRGALVEIDAIAVF